MLRYIMITMIGSLIALGLTNIAAAWTDKIELSDDFSGSEGDEHTPLQEKDYAYLFCEDDSKAERAQRGEIEWARSSAEEYCRFKHKDDPDSWRDGWQRTRLKRGCLNQLQMFNNYAYRCFDPRTDSSVGNFEEQIKAEKARRYEEWQKQYQDRLRIVLEKLEPERRRLEYEIAEAERKKVLQAQEERALEKDLDQASKAIGEFENYQKKYLTRLQERFTTYDALGEKLQQAIVDDSKDLATIRQWNLAAVSKTLSDGTTAEDLAGLRVEHVRMSTTPAWKVCSDSRSAAALQNIRQHQAQTERLVAEYQGKVEGLAIPARFETFKIKIADNIVSVSAASSKRLSVFSEDTDSLNQRSQPCHIYSAMPVLFQMRGELDNLVQITTNTAELAAAAHIKLLEITQNVSRAKEFADLKRAITNIEAGFNKALLEGRVNEAMMLGKASPIVSESIVATAASLEFYSATQLDELRSHSEATNRSVAADMTERLSYPDVKIVLKKHIQRLNSLLTKVDGLSANQPDIADGWLEVRKKIQSTLGQGQQLGAMVSLPALSSLDAVLDFDGKVALVEDDTTNFIASQEGNL